jgi:hypothetical protein
LWVAWLFSSFPPLNRRRHLHFSWCNSSMPKHGPFPRKWLAVSSHLYAIITPIQSSPEHVIYSWCFHCRRRYRIHLSTRLWLK